MKKKVKKISKYILNFANMINLLILGLAEIWGWDIEKISASIVVITGVISTWLVSGKLFSLKENENE